MVLAPSEQHGRLSWYEAPEDPINDKWIEDVDYVHGLGTADMDLDGNVDVVVSEMHRSEYQPDRPSRRLVYIHLNLGKGLKWEQQIIATTGSHNLRLADIDNDGDIDIIGANWSGPYHPVELWRNHLNPVIRSHGRKPKEVRRSH